MVCLRMSSFFCSQKRVAEVAEKFREARHQLLSLPLLSSNLIEIGYSIVEKRYNYILGEKEVASDNFKGVYQRLQQFLSYFKAYWMTPFKIPQFCCYDDDNRTDNRLESWHKRLNSIFRATNPKSGEFVCKYMKVLENIQEMKIERHYNNEMECKIHYANFLLHLGLVRFLTGLQTTWQCTESDTGTTEEVSAGP